MASKPADRHKERNSITFRELPYSADHGSGISSRMYNLIRNKRKQKVYMHQQCFQLKLPCRSTGNHARPKLITPPKMHLNSGPVYDCAASAKYQSMTKTPLGHSSDSSDPSAAAMHSHPPLVGAMMCPGVNMIHHVSLSTRMS